MGFLKVVLDKWLEPITDEVKKQNEIKEKRQEMKKAGLTLEAQLKHIKGLPVSESQICNVYSLPEKYVIEASGLTFNLEKNRVTDVCIKTQTEISKQAVSSIGGAVAGAVLFGPLGAIIGGRAKDRKVI